MRRRFALVVALLAPIAAAGQPAVRSPLPLEAALDWKIAEGFSAVRSPDGALVAVGVRHLRGNALNAGRDFDDTGWPSLVADVHVCVIDVQNGALRDLGHGREPAWSPDGARLVFPSNRDGRTRLWLWNRQTGEVQRLSEAIVHYYPHRAKEWHPVQWTPDGRGVVAALWPENMTIADMNAYVREGADDAGEPRAEGSTVMVYQPATQWPTRDSYAWKPYAIPALSDDSQAPTTRRLDDRLHFCDLGVIEVESGRAQRVLRNVSAHRYELSPDGRFLATTDLARGGARVLVCALRSGRTRVLAEHTGQGSWSRAIAWSPDSRQLAYQRGAEWVTTRLDASQSVDAVTKEPPGWLAGMESPVQVSESAIRPPDLWLKSPGSAPLRLTRLNPAYEEHPLSDLKMIDWQSDDGLPRRGALFLPPDFDPKSPCPLVVWVYGSQALSKLADRFGGDLGYATFLLTTRGYAVFQPDSAVQVGTPLADIGKNILPGINRVVELGYAAPDRIGVFGHSYGGYTTMALLVQTNRFKAAVTYAGVYDLVSIYGKMENGVGEKVEWAERDQGSMGGSPWEYRARYIENSPLFFLDRVQTPVLLLHGDRDNVPVSQADEAYVALRRLGKKVEYARYAGEQHDIHNLGFYPNRVDFWKRVIGWFDRYLGDSGGR